MEKISQSLVLGPLNDAVDLAGRAQENPRFRAYLIQRAWMLTPAAMLMVLTSLACAFGTVLFVGGTRPMFVLLALLIAPFVLAGSLLVQAYVFVSWLEARALAKALGHRLPGRRGLPNVPWVLAAAFVAAPLAMLVSVQPGFGVGVIALLVAAPFAYAHLDRS